MRVIELKCVIMNHDANLLAKLLFSINKGKFVLLSRFLN